MQGESKLTLKGFNIIVYPSEEEGNNFEVILEEGGNEVFQVTIPISVDEDSDSAYSEEFIHYAAQAAIDLYEAGRDTLGEGAGATMKSAKKLAQETFELGDIVRLNSPDPHGMWGPAVKFEIVEIEEGQAFAGYDQYYLEPINIYDENGNIYWPYSALEGKFLKVGSTIKQSAKSSIQKQACVSSNWEDWYLKFKGTPYEDQATSMLEQYIDLQYSDIDLQKEINELNSQERVICHELDQFNIERLKTLDPKQTVIIVNASKKACGFYNTSNIQEYLDKFKDCPLEQQVLAKMNELLEVKTKIVNLRKSINEGYDEATELEMAMKELILICIQQNAIKSTPDTGMESAPMMANDLMELMEGVDINSPLEPMIANKRSFQETEDNLVEMGEQHGGLDPAEIPIEDKKFHVDDKVTFKKKYEDVVHGGVTRTIPQNTKAVINSVWDDHGDIVLVELECGNVVKVPTSVLKK